MFIVVDTKEHLLGALIEGLKCVFVMDSSYDASDSII